MNQNNQNDKCCNCSNETKFWLRIVFCPCYFVYSIFGCFFDERCQIEPYYHSFLFGDNITICILSIIDLVFTIIFKSKETLAFFVVRVISDSLGIILVFLALGCWTEEATDEDHMDPAFMSFTFIQTFLMVGLDIASIILFFLTDCDFKIILLICQIIHLIVPIFLPIIYFKCIK